MTLQRDPDTARGYAASIGDAWRAVRRHDGLDTILAVVVISALIIVGLSLIQDTPPSNHGQPATPPATYQAQ